ncbi:MAG: hypothetical protein KF740_07680 [Ramlibacter sp.]|nr:hypothetical protein [Ramlibacter sp.]
MTLANTDTPALSFTAPQVTVNTLLSFELRVTDDNGIGRPAKVAVTVVPAANVSVKAGHVSRLVQAGHRVSLHASGSAQGLTYAWRQVSPAFPAVTLTGADTANPSFTAPLLLAGGVLRFDVTATDPATGRNATARTAVQVQAPAPTLTPVSVPGQTPSQVPLAGALLQPIQIAVPLQVPQPTLAVPAPSQVLVPNKVPPRALMLLSAPMVVASGGTSVQLGVAASGGLEPYRWAWTQTSGPAAVLTDASQEVLTVQVPTVTSTQALTFEATLTDANGSQRSAVAEVQATLAPQTAPAGPTPTPITPLAPRLVVVNEPTAVLNTTLTNVTVVQTAGPQVQVTQQASGAGTVVLVTAPLLKNHAAHASLKVTGNNAKGETLHYIVPLEVLRPQSTPGAQTAPPQVLPPQGIPKQDDPLIFAAGATDRHVAEASTGALGVVVQGGKGSATYRYEWTYLKATGGPDITINRANTSRASFSTPNVDVPTVLRFHIKVTDGAQTIERDVNITVDDYAASLVVGALAPLAVDAGNNVSLSAPSPTGGVQFPNSDHYHYSIRQVSGTAVTVTAAGSGAAERQSNWTFTAPALAPGAPDAVLQFEFTVVDRADNAAAVTQQVTVKAPVPLVPPPVASFNPPAVVSITARSLALQAGATGGQAPYQYAWTVQPQVTLAAGAAPLSPALADLTATGVNPTLVLPDLVARSSDILTYKLAVTLRVTDAAGAVATSGPQLIDILFNLSRRGTETLQCGDLATQQACTDLDLVLAMTSPCPDTQPYAMNEIVKVGVDVLEFRRCVDATEAYNLWYLGSRENPLCRPFDPASRNLPGDFTCHLACYGDGCNIDTNPPKNTLLGPPDSHGFPSIGVPALSGP